MKPDAANEISADERDNPALATLLRVTRLQGRMDSVDRRLEKLDVEVCGNSQPGMKKRLLKIEWWVGVHKWVEGIIVAAVLVALVGLAIRAIGEQVRAAPAVQTGESHECPSGL